MALARPADWKDPDYTEVFAERHARLRRIRRDQEAWTCTPEGERPALSPWQRVHAHYRDNPVDWMEDWLTTFDPRNINLGRPAFVPFLLFPRQREFVGWLCDRFDRGEAGLVEKSRDMGISWVCLAFATHLWFYRAGVKVSFGSRKEALVDNLGDPDSLLEKVRLMVRMLPIEMRPLGYSEKEDARYMKIRNRENGSTITGEAGENIGRGGRSSLYFVDEAAFVDKPDRVEAALSQNTDCRIDVSTPNGTGNPFYRKRNAGVIKLFTYKWTMDPRKDRAWYERKKEELEPEVLAQEVDLDYEASAGDVAVPARWVTSSILLRKELERCGALPDRPPDGVAGVDVGGGTAKSVFVPRHEYLVGRSEHWTDDDTTNTAGRARDLAREKGCSLIKYDSIGVGKGVTAAFKRMPDVKVLAINVGEAPSNRLWEDGKRATKKFSNKRAELWWVVRDRLRRTHEHWLHVESDGRAGKKYPLDKLLLLSDDPRVRAQLSLPRYGYTTSGKIQIERKESMRSRGVPSPDHADALVLTFAPAPPRAKSGRATGMF